MCFRKEPLKGGDAYQNCKDEECKLEPLVPVELRLGNVADGIRQTADAISRM
jgi:hypothetical protein